MWCLENTTDRLRFLLFGLDLSTTYFDFDRTNGLCLVRHTLLFIPDTRQSVPLAEIVEVVTKRTQRLGFSFYALSLRLSGVRKLSAPSLGKRHTVKAARAVAHFLGIG
jgi:hypothetical protein